MGNAMKPMTPPAQEGASYRMLEAELRRLTRMDVMRLGAWADCVKETHPQRIEEDRSGIPIAVICEPCSTRTDVTPLQPQFRKVCAVALAGEHAKRFATPEQAAVANLLRDVQNDVAMHREGLQVPSLIRGQN